MVSKMRSQNPLVGIYYTEPEQKKRVEQLAVHLQLPLTKVTAGYDLLLTFSEGRLNLFAPNQPSLKGKVYTEFVKGTAGYRRKHGKKELLLRAIGFRKDRPPNVLDVTGGLGKDSFLMASHGCTVHILERNRIVAALLNDGLQRALGSPQTIDIAARIKLTVQDSIQYMQNIFDLGSKFDVIYLDPMFPPRSKSALVKKEMQLLQKLIGRKDDGLLLLQTALKAAEKRVVVKRAKKAQFLGDRKPTHSLEGKTIRYDVFLIS